MREISRNKQTIKISVFITSIFVILLSVTYAFINVTLTGTRKQVITAGNLSLELVEDNEIKIDDAFPMYDEVGMLQSAFNFRLINNSPLTSDYTVKLVDITDSVEKLDFSIIKYGLTKDGVVTVGSLSELENLVIDTGTISGNETIEYSLRLWIDSRVEENDLISGKTLKYRIDVEAVQSDEYQEELLNGTDPVLSDNLVPVVIEDDGKVLKADVTTEWYKYEEARWANAVVLEDKTVSYAVGDTIPEENIESYFVWIPRYKYRLFNMGEYSSLTSVEKKEQIIEIEFENKNVPPSVGTQVGDFHSHPAFQAFDTNGFWVGKFESGYRGATSTATAQVNSNDSTKLIIKPNMYSWRSITVGNAFKVSYDYLRSDESHMMKNTEWGSVAYLTSSKYGRCTNGVCEEIRINNNKAFITGYAAKDEPTTEYPTYENYCEITTLGVDGTKTYNYRNTLSQIASTTKNITGIYDMSGGAFESVMGYNTKASSVGGKSGITEIYEDFFTNPTWEKYYDQYSNTSGTVFTNRILGDATGEMGPFALGNRNNPYGSWYHDSAGFLDSTYSWFLRGLDYSHGLGSGLFSCSRNDGTLSSYYTFRLVLTPTVI